MREKVVLWTLPCPNRLTGVEQRKQQGKKNTESHILTYAHLCFNPYFLGVSRTLLLHLDPTLDGLGGGATVAPELHKPKHDAWLDFEQHFAMKK